MLILPQQLEQITRLLALQSGKSPEDILKEAIEASARAAGVAVACEPKQSPDQMMAAITDIANHCASLPLLDRRAPDEIIGYDEFGIPR